MYFSRELTGSCHAFLRIQRNDLLNVLPQGEAYKIMSALSASTAACTIICSSTHSIGTSRSYWTW
jgi:hypothetical protein